MGFFARLLGSDSPVEKIQKAFDRRDWALVRSLAESVASSLSPVEQSQVLQLSQSAGDQLAKINLAEASACLRADNLVRAEEHLLLARAQAVDPPLVAAVKELLTDLGQSVASEPSVVAANCGSCSGHVSSADDTHVADYEPPDEVWELLLAAFPPHWADRYSQLDEPLQQAVLLAHSGDDAAAQTQMLQIPEAERCEVIRYELAGTLLRTGELQHGTEQLRELLDDFPEHDLALQVLVDLVMQQAALPWLPELLQENISRGIQPGLAHAGLAKLAAITGNEVELVEQAQAAFNHGYLDYDLLIWSAHAMERAGKLDEAESLLSQLPGGGCSGGAHPLLAEFWLRQEQQVDQALEGFKGVARQEPENPRWALRIAQCYLHKGWKKEAGSLLEQILRTQDLDDELKHEATTSRELLAK